MFTQTLEQSPKNRRGGGQTSYLLLAPAQFGSRNLAITWVQGAPGSQQSLHAHPDSEQVYVIVAGRGRMMVDGQERDVGAGTMVLIPPGAQHAIRNPGPEQLIYVTATSPPFPLPTGEFAYHLADDSSPNSA
jgi:mannose-6-phosphate isomerase-like protein (cupin superfamily)